MSVTLLRNTGTRKPLPIGHLLTGALLATGLAGCKNSSVDGGAMLTGNMDVLPTTPFSSSSDRGGPFDDTALYTVRNSGEASLFWSVQPSASWLLVSAASGTLDPSGTVPLTVSIDPTVARLLDTGRHSASLVFRDLGRGVTVATIPASLEILPVDPDPGDGGVIVTPSALTTGGPKGGPFAPSSQVLTLHNPGTGSSQWTASSDVPWLLVAPNSGTLAAGAQQQVTVSIQAGAAGALGSGHHAGRITFLDAADFSSLEEFDVSLGVGTTIENLAWLNVHGRPFFPIGVWNQPPWEAQVLYLKGLGINTYLNNGLTPPEPTNGQLMDLMEAHDMWAILHFDAAVKDHPRLLGWLLGDEPDLYNRPPSQVRQEYDAIKSIDQDHFVGLNLTPGFFWDSNYGDSSLEGLYQSYLSIPDIGSFDMYPVSGWNQPGWVYMPGAMTEFMLEHYFNRQRPAWAIIEASDPRLSWTPPETTGPSPAQMRFQVWDAIIHGATAIHYFTIAFDPFEWTNLTPAIEQELTRTNGQITALTSVILSPAPALSVSSSESSGLAHNFMLRRSGTTYYLFADNADMGDRVETITFTFPLAVSSVSVWGEGRSLAPVGNAFTDTFQPLEVHIYEIEL